MEYDTNEKVLTMGSGVLDVKEGTVVINKKNKKAPTQKWTISTTGLECLTLNFNLFTHLSFYRFTS